MPDRARPPDGPSPEDIITATMRRLLLDGEPIRPDLAAKQILHNLAGHRYRLVHEPAAPERCPDHPNTDPDPRGFCRICGPKGL